MRRHVRVNTPRVATFGGSPALVAGMLLRGAVPACGGDIRFPAQGQPNLTRVDATRDRLNRREVSKLVQNKVLSEGAPVALTELGCNGLPEFAYPHDLTVAINPGTNGATAAQTQTTPAEKGSRAEVV